MKRKALFKKLLAVGLAATFALSSVSGALATEEPGTELTTEAVSEMATEAETETVTEAAAEAVSETPTAAETAEFGAETLNEKGIQEEILVYYENEDGTMLNETGVLYAELSTWVDSAFIPVPSGYELVSQNSVLIEDAWIQVKVRPVEEAEEVDIYVNYWDQVNNKQAGEGSITVPADTVKINTADLTDVPSGYELATLGEVDIMDYAIYVEVRPIQQNTRMISVWMYDANDNTPYCEGESVEVTVIERDGYEYVDVNSLPMMAGYTTADATDDGLIPLDGSELIIYVTPLEAPSQVEVTVEYVDVENGNHLVGYETVMADPEDHNINTSVLTKIPEGYELVYTGDLEIRETSAGTKAATAKVRPVAATKEIGVNYYDRENGVQIAESSVTVDANAIHVNTSLLTDVPEGYELAVTGDLQIMDGWIFAEVRKIADTKEIGVNYYDRENGVQVAESSVTVDADAIHVNTSLLTDVPEGYELVVTGDLQIMDGWIFAEVRKTETTVAVRYYIAAEDKYVEGQPVTVSRDAVYINTTTLTDVPEGYEIVWLGDEPIRDGVVTVEIRAIETTKEVAVKYYIEAEDRTIDGQSVKVDKDASYINTGILKDVPNGYELVWTGDLPIENGTVVVEIRAKKLDVDFVIADSSMGSFADTAYAGMTIVSFTDLEASTGTQYGIPAVKAAEGYVFTGWKDSTGAILWDAMKTTFEVVPDMGIYMEGAANGTLVLTAQFAPAETEPETTAPTEPETTPVTEPETTAPTEPETTVPDEIETPVSEPETTVDEPADDGWDDGEEEETSAAGTETNESETKAAADAAEASADGSVKTGDETPLGLYASIMVLAAAVIIGVLAKVRRTQR